MDRVHEGVHRPGPLQGWSMDLGFMFCIRPECTDAEKRTESV